MTLCRGCVVFVVGFGILFGAACGSKNEEREKATGANRGIGKLGTNATSPPLSVDLVTISGNCYAFPQHPTVSISDQNQVYWHSDDTTNVSPYTVSYNIACVSNSSTGSLTVPAAPGSGNSGTMTLPDCSQYPYEMTYSVTNSGGTKCIGNDMGIHITR